jgi:hypothetical protein
MQTIGTCSNCGGPVQVPEFWGGIEPPVPRCRNCNALAKKTYGPIVPMDKPNPHDQTYLDAFGQAKAKVTCQPPGWQKFNGAYSGQVKCIVR